MRKELNSTNPRKSDRFRFATEVGGTATTVLFWQVKVTKNVSD